MRLVLPVTVVALAIGAAACNELATTPPSDNPASATMTFKQGARFEYSSRYRSATTGQDTNARTRIWTLSNTSASVHGRTGVAVYVDSVFAVGGGFVNLTDSVLLYQQPGTNDIYRWASILGELDLSASIPLLGSLDLGRDWEHEARLNATSVHWFVGEVADTVANTFGIPAVNGFKVAISDSAVASATESLTVGSQSYQTTRTTHNLHLGVFALVGIGGFSVPVEVGGTTITRTTWVAPSLGAIVKEEREGKVLDVSYQGQGFQVPIPGYSLVMTRVIVSP